MKMLVTFHTCRCKVEIESATKTFQIQIFFDMILVFFEKLRNTSYHSKIYNVFHLPGSSFSLIVARTYFHFFFPS